MWSRQSHLQSALKIAMTHARKEAAGFFLANCPGVKMGGGGDGVPCEKQWCGDR